MSKSSNRAVKVDPTIIYPESDGKPMADNTKQYQYIVMLHTGIDSHFAADPNVLVVADLLWYPVEGWPSISCAPDVMVVFGRPKGHRRSYRQWAEGGIAPQVTIEILSPSNTPVEMEGKRAFYERHGIKEYIAYDPDRGTLGVWERKGAELMPIIFGKEWKSPRLGITLKLEDDGELSAFHPDGRKFLKAFEIDLFAQQEHARAEQERARAEQERIRAAQAEALAAQERERAAQAEALAAQERERANRLADQLRALGIDPETRQ